MSMSFTVTISSYCSRKRACRSTSLGSSAYPRVRYRRAFSNRSGVPLRPSRSGSSPIFARRFRTSSCIMESSYSTRRGAGMKKGPARRPVGAVAEGLKQALLNEIEGREFYRMAAGSARTDAARQIFEFLMGEEERHREEILSQIARMAEGKPLRLLRGDKSKRAIRKFRSPLFSPDFAR